MGFDMLVKVILLFLLAMALIGMIGKVLFPDATSRLMRRKKAVSACRSCGKPLIGKGNCTCGGKV